MRKMKDAACVIEPIDTFGGRKMQPVSLSQQTHLVAERKATLRPIDEISVRRDPASK
jgi:hypothetical protein